MKTRGFSVLVGLCIAASLFGYDESVTGGVSLGFSGPGASSYGWAKVYCTICVSTSVVGTHYIYDAANTTVIAWKPFDASPPSVGYADYVFGTGGAGRCYRAALNATASSTGVKNSFTSGQFCTPASPPYVDPACEPSPRQTGAVAQGKPFGTGLLVKDRPTFVRADTGADSADQGNDTDERPIIRTQGQTCGKSPIIIDLDGEGFPLSDPRDPVTFDFEGSGHREETAWTLRGSRVGFLALDRDGNGSIDSGLELFGNYTITAFGDRAVYGYIALAEFDYLSELGGNGNHMIEPGDAVWRELRVWVDSNHNGISESDELFTLDDVGITKIDPDYTISWKRDKYGNLFSAKGKAWMRNKAGKEREIKTYDVFFVPGK